MTVIAGRLSRPPRFVGSGFWMAILALLGGCQYSPDTAQRSLAYNQGIATFTQDLFLLNVIRAGERAPTFFTRNTADTTTSTFSPQIGASFSRAPATTSTQAIYGAGGAASGTVITKGVSTVLMAVAPQLAATETNQLTLSNADDRDSTNGLLAAMKVSEIANYMSQGYNGEQLYLIMLASISIPTEGWNNLPLAAKTYCSSKDPRNEYCPYIKSILPPDLRTTRDLIAYNPGCFAAPVAAENELAKRQLLHVENDAAIRDLALTGRPDVSNNVIRSFTCFRQGLELLLALGLKTTAAPDSLLYRFPADTISGAPKLIAELDQQGLLVVPHGGGGIAQPTEFAVCKAPADSETFSLAASTDPAVLALIGTTERTPGPRMPGIPLIVGTVANDPCDADTGTSSASLSQDIQPRVELSVTPRSLEGMVYFLGQIVRGTTLVTPSNYSSAPCSEPFFINKQPSSYVGGRVCGEPGGFYREQLFKVETGTRLGMIASVSTAYGVFSIPGPCRSIMSRKNAVAGDVGPAPPGQACSLQYPDHASPQVLTLLNQIWGLHKTQSTPPIIPTVNFVGH